MPLHRVEVVPESDATKYILLNSIGDEEFLAAPETNQRWHLTDLLITVDNPGIDAVTVTIKSDVNTIAVIPINAYAIALATTVELAGDFGEAINVHADAAVNVHFTASYYLRKDGKAIV